MFAAFRNETAESARARMHMYLQTPNKRISTLWTEVWPTRLQRGSVGSGVVAESAADSAVARAIVYVCVCSLWLGTSRISLSLYCLYCLCVIRVPVCPVCPVAVCVQAHRRSGFSVWV